jgi:hypothetical protein
MPIIFQNQLWYQWEMFSWFIREQLGLCWDWVGGVLVESVTKHWKNLLFLVSMLFAVKHLNIFLTNSSVHCANTRQQIKLHIPSLRHYSIQRGVYYSSVKIFNHLPQYIVKYNNVHTFKTLLSDYLVKNAFFFHWWISISSSQWCRYINIYI